MPSTPEKAAARAKWRYHNDTEYRAKKDAYYERNRERIIEQVKARTDPEAKREYDRRYGSRPEVRERRAAQRRAWKEANPEKTFALNKAASHRRRNARPDAEGKAYMMVLYRDPCCYCGGPSEHVDHIVPLKAGGDSAWNNLTAACASCNFSKRAASLLHALVKFSHPSSNGSY